MRPVRIAHLINSLEQGGAERVLVELLERTASDARQQHEVVTLLAGGFHSHGVRNAGAPLKEIGLHREGAGIGAVLRSIRVLHRSRPDVLVCWLYQSCVIGTVAKPLLPRTRLIWNLRGTAKDPEQMSRNHRISVRLLGPLSMVPWAIAVNSRAGRTDHEELGFHARRWAYVPNGFHPEAWPVDADNRARVRRELNLPETSTVFVMVARADPQKDHVSLIRAFTAVVDDGRDVHLVLVGWDTERLDVPRRAAERIRCLGPRSDVQLILTAADVGVLSSAFGEGLPNAVAEKMLSGLPCIVTDSGDSAHLVGSTGRVVARRDTLALAEAIRWFASLHPDERRGFGERARERVARLYPMSAMVAGFERLWSDLYDESPHG